MKIWQFGIKLKYKSKGGNCVIATVYNNEGMLTLKEDLEQLLEETCEEKTLIVGDFNSRMWGRNNRGRVFRKEKCIR